MYAAAPSFFRQAFKAFAQPPPDEVLPLLSSCYHEADAGPPAAAGLAHRVLRLVLLRRWLDVDAVTGRDPYRLLALLVVLGAGVFALQRTFIKGFLPVRSHGAGGAGGGGSSNSSNTNSRAALHHQREWGPGGGVGGGGGALLPEAEEQRVGEKCVRVFLHRCFLVACIVASFAHPDQPWLRHPRAHYAFFREWIFYLFSAACAFLLRRTLLLSEAALEHVAAVAPPPRSAHRGSSTNFSSSKDNDEPPAAAVGRWGRPSFGTVLLWLGANLLLVHAFIYRQLAAAPPPGLVSLYPLAIYDAMQLLLEAGQVALKYAGLAQDEDEEEDEDEDDEDEKEASAAATKGPEGRRKEKAAGCGLRQRLWAWAAWWGWDAAAVQQHVGFYLGFTAACVAMVQHLHVWALKGVGADGVGGGAGLDFVFFFLLQRCLWRVLHVARSFFVALSIARLIDRRFPPATEADLRRRAGHDGDGGPDVCSICLKALRARSNVKRLPCNHLLHASCLLQCLAHGAGNNAGGGGEGEGLYFSSSTAKCPLCRRGLLFGRDEGSTVAVEEPAAAIGAATAAAAPAVGVGAGPAEVPGVGAGAGAAGNPPAAALAVGGAAPGAGAGEERALLRLSTDDLLPSWLPLPLPSFSVEVVRRRPNRAPREEAAEGEGEAEAMIQIPPQQQ